MAKLSQGGEKTEKATPRKRKEARREGQVAKSQEVGVAVGLLGALLTLQVFLPRAIQIVRDRSVELIATAQSDELPIGDIRAASIEMMVGVVGPFLVMALIAGLVAGIAQVGFAFTPKAARPKLKHLSPKQGLQRFKPAKMGWELMRTAAKLFLLMLLMWQPLTSWIADVGQRRGFDGGMAATSAMVMALVWRAVMLAAVIAAADFAWQRWRHAKELKMSRYEVKQEFKQTEGDPFIKAQRRARAREYSRNRMLSDVMHADVVVTNPTHFAVALRYGPGDAAPRVVAKGMNQMAAKIKAIAYRHGVHVVEDKPLARGLYRRVKVGRTIPSALYEAVAVVLALAYRRRARRFGAGETMIGASA